MKISKKCGVITAGPRQVEVDLIRYQYSYELKAGKRIGTFDGVPADVQFTSGVDKTTKETKRCVYFRTGKELWYAYLSAEDWHAFQEARGSISATSA